MCSLFFIYISHLTKKKEHIRKCIFCSRYIALPTGPLVQKLESFMKNYLLEVIELQILLKSNISHFKSLKLFHIYDLDVTKETEVAYNLQDCITWLALYAFI